MNGPAKMISETQEGTKISGAYENGMKNGVFLIEKLNKYNEKVTYRG